MTVQPDPPARSALDSARFGVEIYRGRITGSAGADTAFALATTTAVDMLIARVPAAELEVAQRFAQRGALLAGTLVGYRGATDHFSAGAPPSGYTLGLATAKDRDALDQVARSSFTDFAGHYHADPRLDRTAATEGYVQWCLACLDQPGHEVAVVRSDGDLVAFATVRVDDDVAEILLNGVHPAHQRRGLYAALVRHIGASLRLRSKGWIESSTQLSNLAPQKVWVRHGLEPAGSFFTFHLWYDAL